ncbi:MAG: sulfite exporter TauE/SafE family protein [Flavobacteriales bacterium]|nr:sulfite exporter TauE/SafE family protein [Flavobacteriales bacterium]
MEVLVISIVTFIICLLTFFSGFGLGTLLTPFMMLFFPVDIAIGLTAVVHLFNNLFKWALVGKKASINIILNFGVPAIIAAMIGSWLLLQWSDLPILHTYEMFGKSFEITPIKLIIGLLLLIFASLDIIPKFQSLAFPKKWMPIGGILSGFFGGLSGNQGAFRSAFLIKSGLSKELFVGTTVVISTLVDFTRLGIYSQQIQKIDWQAYQILLLTAIISGILGSWLGNYWLKKVTLSTLKHGIAWMLMLLSFLLALGIL